MPRTNAWKATGPANPSDLSMACAAVGDFVKAAKWETQAIALGPSDPGFQNAAHKRLESYRAGKPIRSEHGLRGGGRLRIGRQVGDASDCLGSERPGLSKCRAQTPGKLPGRQTP